MLGRNKNVLFLLSERTPTNLFMHNIRELNLQPNDTSEAFLLIICDLMTSYGDIEIGQKWIM